MRNQLPDNIWESLDKFTARLKVPGGWIVRSRYVRINGGASVHQIFIADQNHDWENKN